MDIICYQWMVLAISLRPKSIVTSAVKSTIEMAIPPTTIRCWAWCWCTLITERFSLSPEPILKQDGAAKNDCERNAAKRLLTDLRREHPHLKLRVIEEDLASNALHIKLLKLLDMRFILGAKETDHRFLFDWVANTKTTQTHEFVDDSGTLHRFRYLNGALLNEANFDTEINFLEYWETKPSGKTQHFSWVTNTQITVENLMALMRAARARWKVENETFNTLPPRGPSRRKRLTLKNQGYLIPDWESLYSAIAFGLKPTPIAFNTF